MVQQEVVLKPGQKFPTPTPGVGDRVFYETLLRQRPESAMAQEWCVQYGVLPHDEAERLLKKITERKRLSKSSSTLSSPAPSVQKKKKKVKLENDHAADPDMHISGTEAMGSVRL